MAVEPHARRLTSAGGRQGGRLGVGEREPASFGDVVAITQPRGQRFLHGFYHARASARGNVLADVAPRAGAVPAFGLTMGLGERQMLEGEPVVDDERMLFER